MPWRWEIDSFKFIKINKIIKFFRSFDMVNTILKLVYNPTKKAKIRKISFKILGFPLHYTDLCYIHIFFIHLLCSTCNIRKEYNLCCFYPLRITSIIQNRGKTNKQSKRLPQKFLILLKCKIKFYISFRHG